MALKNYQSTTAHDAITATATSESIDVSYADKVGIQFTRAAGAGNTVWTVTGTVDGTNWVAISNLVDNVANTNAETLARSASVTQSSATSAVVALPPEFPYKAIKVVATITTGGASTAVVTKFRSNIM